METEKVTQQDFAREYQELCKRMNMQIVGVPVWTPTNHGTFELSVQLQVAQIEQKQGL